MISGVRAGDFLTRLTEAMDEGHWRLADRRAGAVGREATPGCRSN